jgi:hypothetical protein
MKKIFVTLAIMHSANLSASSTPIEPVLVPIVDSVQSINIQMGKYEVTVEEFSRFVNATGYEVEGQCHLYNQNHTPEKKHGTWNNPELTNEPYLPVVCLGADDAMAYAKWLTETTGKRYRLPKFDEWLFAATAGKTSRFSYGEDLHVSEVCNYENIEDAANNAGLKLHHNTRYRSSANCNDGAIYHTVVGMYRPNYFGLHDMMGNVREILQTCDLVSKKDPSYCQHHVVAGGGWHWMPRPANVKDSISFKGSIEGFRLVLDSSKAKPMSKQTQHFVEDLAIAQQRASIEHQRLKSLPNKPKGVSASLANKKEVFLRWLPSKADNVTYDIYRSYLDPKGVLSREMTKIAAGIERINYVDQLPGKGVASYQVFANNSIGESQPSMEVFVGKHQIFKVDDRIQAEFYNQYRNTHIIANEKAQSVLFSSNEGHYPPELTPFSPAWLSYDFDSDSSSTVTLEMNIRGGKGAIIEFWQGKHLVAKVELEGSKEFVKMAVVAELNIGNEPIQVRQANKHYFVLDWFELH